MKFENSWVCLNCKPVFLQKLKEGVATSSNLLYGGFWIRFGAKFIDGIIIMFGYLILIMPIYIGLTYMMRKSMEGGGAAHVGITIALAMLPSLLNMAMVVGFNTFFIGRYGATPGKMACRLKVVNADGTPVTKLKALGRSCAEMLEGFTLDIGYLIAAWDDEKRTLHDRICNTRVIQS
jgi:uncharacterized RDD family membrane protein YckC